MSGFGNGVCHVNQLNAHPTHPSMGRVSIIDQNITRAGEGIASTDGTGRSADGTCDLHCPIWIRKNARKKICQEVAQLRPSQVAQLSRTINEVINVINAKSKWFSG